MTELEELRRREIEKAEQEFEQAVKDGVPIVTMNVFDQLDNYVPSDRIKNNIDYTIEIYTDLINRLKELPEEAQLEFLTLLKEADIVDNQSIEKENSFKITMRSKLEKYFAIDYLLEKQKTALTKDDLVAIHDQLLSGTSSEDLKGLRDNNLKFVGRISQTPTKYGNKIIDYLPIRYTEIDVALEKFLGFYNGGVKPNNQYDVMLIPMAYHGIIAILQLFKDGNTRLGRLLQNAEMYKLMNEVTGENLPLPLVYATRQYANYRNKYRGLVTNIVVQNNAEAWDEWFNFNLSRLQDGIYFNDQMLTEYMHHYKFSGRR